MVGKALINDINACTVRGGSLALWWLGQHSFAVKVGGKVLYLDPFLSAFDGRQIPPLLAPKEVSNADLVFGSHDHADHIDRGAWPDIAAASPGCRFVVPELVREQVASDLGIPAERFVGSDDGGVADIDGVRITGVASAHEFLDRDEATGHYPYLGFVIEVGGCALYHSGDTCLYEGLPAKLRPWRLDVAMLPINGRDAERLRAGCIGNMTYQETADLAGSLSPGLTIPTHYDMFATNSEDPRLFVDYMAVKYPALRVLVPGYGERVVV